MARIVLLAAPGLSTWIIANALAREHADLVVIIEKRENSTRVLRRRIRKLGIATVVGQIMFHLWGKVAAYQVRARTREIICAFGLDVTPLPPTHHRQVASANDPSVVRLINFAAPDVVVVNGTRILSRTLLNNLQAPVLNTHAGITPAYRGVHGGYWARARGDLERCGVTIHMVDAGVDTGSIVAQAAIEPGPRDNFFTYPILQTAAGLPLLLDAVRAARIGTLRARNAKGESRQYYHPTLWGYIATGLRRGVW